MINILIADNSILIQLGIKSLLNEESQFNFINEATTKEELIAFNKEKKPDVIIVDLESLFVNELEVSLIKKQNKNASILGISKLISKKTIVNYLNSGVTSFLLKECDKNEIIDAINSTAQGLRFLCGKIAHAIACNEEINLTPNYLKQVSCEGLVVSEREIEVIKYIAEGFSNKQIADAMYLSTHTINTHRKNIMNKLGINNTAGIVMFAVRNNILN
jgi:DNA-binding NarL/FixJ family response regulator